MTPGRSWKPAFDPYQLSWQSQDHEDTKQMAAAATGAKQPAWLRLWRYNYGVLVGTGYWVVVLPIAASQIVTLWMMAVGGDFTQLQATRIAELMTPIIGAFLVAHSLAPEYRSGVGAVLACKPVSLHRVVTLRVGIAMLAAVLLTLVTLGICSFGIRRVEIGPPVAASLPSLWFLSLLALTFATLFRSALAGFAVCAGLWALDVVFGFSVHPLLSLQGLHATLDRDPLAELWTVGKGVLVVVGLALLLIHTRLLPRICRPVQRGDVLQVAAAVAVVVLVYSISGASISVAYAYSRRGDLPHTDVIWLQRQLGLYGPVPISAIFGPAFSTYVSKSLPVADENQKRSPRILQLEQALEKWPKSMWADSIAFALASEKEKVEPAEAGPAFFLVADRYGSSPFAPRALVRVIIAETDQVTAADRLQAARRLVAEYPTRPEAERAADAMLPLYPKTVGADEFLRAVEVATNVGPRYRRPTWSVVKATVEAERGRNEQAIAAARSAVSEAQELLKAPIAPGNRDELSPHRARIAHALNDANALLKKLGANPE